MEGMIMGHSRTYNVLGYSDTIDGKRYIFPAMNRTEMFQEQVKAAKENRQIREWVAQTRTGERMLGGLKACHVDTPPETRGMIPCPRCCQKGCQICNWSGWTTKKWLSGFRSWQLEPISDRNDEEQVHV